MGLDSIGRRGHRNREQQLLRCAEGAVRVLIKSHRYRVPFELLYRDRLEVLLRA